jgi:hypothetical protein
MSYLLTFAAGMSAMLAAITFTIGLPLEGAKYSAVAIASLAVAWWNRPARAQQEGKD